jgi:hypothetical protein
MKLYGKSMEDYKRSDPDGAFGYWMDLMMISLISIGCLSPFVLVIGYFAR